MTQTNQNPVSENVSTPRLGGELRDQRPTPPGVVPKQSQAYVIAGLAVLILFAVMFSNKRAHPAEHPAVNQAAFANEANQHEIEQLKRDLSDEQRRVEQPSPAHPGAVTPSQGQDVTASDRAAESGAGVTTQPPRDQIADAERALLFKARFASNLVSPAEAKQQQTSASAVKDTDVPFEDSAMASPLRTPQVGAHESTQTADARKRPAEVNVNSAQGEPYVLFEGTTIDTALVNRLDGEFSGPVKVMVTNPVYSQDRQHVLIPEGTFILGEVQKVSGFGQKRLAVTFHRMLMPDGYSVDLDQFRGLDQAGETGLKDKINNHYVQIFGTSIALGIISGAAESTTNAGLNASGSDLWRQGAASGVSQSSADVLDRFTNIPPTITIREGHRVKVYLTQDLLLPAYENHTIPPNI